MTSTSVRHARPGGHARTLRPTTTDGERPTWERRGLCRDDFRYTDGPFGTGCNPKQLAIELAHRCRAHCPVVEDCAAQLIAQRPARPRRAVRAGVWFPDSGAPKVLDDSGCGEHCAGLPAARLVAGAR